MFKGWEKVDFFDDDFMAFFLELIWRAIDNCCLTRRIGQLNSGEQDSWRFYYSERWIVFNCDFDRIFWLESIILSECWIHQICTLCFCFRWTSSSFVEATETLTPCWHKQVPHADRCLSITVLWRIIITHFAHCESFNVFVRFWYELPCQALSVISSNDCGAVWLALPCCTCASTRG